MKEENLTRKILAELLTESNTNGKFDTSPQKKNLSNKADSGPTSESARDEREKKLRRIINFGAGFYSIAEAHAVSGIGEAFIRKWISEGRLTLLTYPDSKRQYISGIEFSDVIIQHNLNKLKSR